MLLLLLLFFNSNPLLCSKQKANKTIDSRRNQVFKLIQATESRPIKEFRLTKEFISSVGLYWSDPGYVEGPDIKVQKMCWLLSYQTESLNDDGSIRYKDYYTYYFPIRERVVYMRNRYSGIGYHGGSFIVLTDNNDHRFDRLNKVLVRTKDSVIVEIGKILSR
jgi:hypothetical protein